MDHHEKCRDLSLEKGKLECVWHGKGWVSTPPRCSDHDYSPLQKAQSMHSDCVKVSYFSVIKLNIIKLETLFTSVYQYSLLGCIGNVWRHCWELNTGVLSHLNYIPTSLNFFSFNFETRSGLIAHAGPGILPAPTA